MNIKSKIIYNILSAIAENNVVEGGNFKTEEPKEGIIGKAAKIMQDLAETIASLVISQKDINAIDEYLCQNPVPDEAPIEEHLKYEYIGMTLLGLAALKRQRSKEYKQYLKDLEEEELLKMQPIIEVLDPDMMKPILDDEDTDQIQPIIKQDEEIFSLADGEGLGLDSKNEHTDKNSPKNETGKKGDNRDTRGTN